MKNFGGIMVTDATKGKVNTAIILGKKIWINLNWALVNDFKDDSMFVGQVTLTTKIRYDLMETKDRIIKTCPTKTDQ